MGGKGCGRLRCTVSDTSGQHRKSVSDSSGRQYGHTISYTSGWQYGYTVSDASGQHGFTGTYADNGRAFSGTLACSHHSAGNYKTGTDKVTRTFRYKQRFK